MPGNQGLAMIQPALTAVRPQPGSYGLRHFAFARGWMGLLFGNLFHLSQGKYAIPHETVHLTQIVPHKLPYFRAAAIEIGRASCRERGCQYVEISGSAE